MSPGPQRMGKAYQGALEAVLAVVVGVASGAFADSRLGTSPILLLLGVAASRAMALPLSRPSVITLRSNRSVRRSPLQLTVSTTAMI